MKVVSSQLTLIKKTNKSNPPKCRPAPLTHAQISIQAAGAAVPCSRAAESSIDCLARPVQSPGLQVQMLVPVMDFTLHPSHFCQPSRNLWMWSAVSHARWTGYPSAAITFYLLFKNISCSLHSNLHVSAPNTHPEQLWLFKNKAIANRKLYRVKLSCDLDLEEKRGG